MLNGVAVSKRTAFGLSTNSAMKVSEDVLSEWYASFDSYYFMNSCDQPNLCFASVLHQFSKIYQTKHQDESTLRSWKTPLDIKL